MLIPTIIRTEGAEIWASWNPNKPTDPVEVLFNSLPDKNKILTHVNYTDNPFLNADALDEINNWKNRSPETFGHVWLGEYNSRSEAIIFSGKYEVDFFEPQKNWDGPYYGADWGFSQDPTTLVKLWVFDNRLWIEKEIYKVGLEITDTPTAFRTILDSDRREIIADNARPETISHAKRNGLNVIPCDKWKGSVEDGIAFMRNFEKIIIHPDCHHAFDEFRLYSYKTDRLTDAVLPDIIDADNHIIDACRYALGKMIKRKNSGGFVVL